MVLAQLIHFEEFVLQRSIDIEICCFIGLKTLHLLTESALWRQLREEFIAHHVSVLLPSNLSTPVQRGVGKEGSRIERCLEVRHFGLFEVIQVLKKFGNIWLPIGKLACIKIPQEVRNCRDVLLGSDIAIRIIKGTVLSYLRMFLRVLNSELREVAKKSALLAPRRFCHIDQL